MKLKTGMLDHMNNTFRNTVFKISADVPLKDVSHYGHNVLRLFNILPSFSFATSKADRGY